MYVDKRISEQQGGLSLNFDKSDKELQVGESRYLLNCNSGVTKNGKRGSITSEKGNTLIEVDLPEGENRVIGKCRRTENNSLIWMIYNDNLQHNIIQYQIDTNTIEYIVKDSIVPGFQADSYLDNPLAIDGLLCYVDRNTEARRFNIQKAINFFKNSGERYRVFDETTITAIEVPPVFCPIPKYITDYSRDTNFVKNKQFQFAYRYKMDDGERTVFSPWSNIPYPPQDMLLIDQLYRNDANRHFNIEPDTLDSPFSHKISYNAIRLQEIRIGHYTCDSIEIAFKEGETGIWKIAGEIDNQEQLDLGKVPGDLYNDFVFYNDQEGLSISDEEMNRSQDFFPINPATQEYLHTNQMVYSNFFDQHDLPKPNVLLNHRFNVMKPYYDSSHEVTLNDFIILPASPTNWMGFNLPPLSLLQEGYVLAFTIRKLNQFGNAVIELPAVGYVVTDADIAGYPQTLEENIITAIEMQGFETNVRPTSSPFTTFPYSNYDFFFRLKADHYSTNILNFWTYDGKGFLEPTAKTGAYHQFGIVYYDEWGRHTSAVTGEDLRIYIPTIGEESPDNPEHFTAEIEMQIKHRPPQDAHSYQIVYLPRMGMGDYLQYVAQTEKKNELKYSAWNDYKEKYPYVKRGFEFAVDDFIRRMKKDENVNIDKNDNFQAVTVDVDTSIITLPTLTSIKVDDIVEEYKKTDQSTTPVFKEFGQCYEIGNPGPNGFHKGSDQDQNPSNPISIPAVITLKRLDSWARPRTMVHSNIHPFREPLIIEDPNYSDFWDSPSDGLGRSHPENKDYKRTHEKNLLRHTRSYLQGTNTNGLNSVEGDAQVAVSIQFGEITATREVGYTLKVYQERKSNSIYIGRESPVRADGSEDLVYVERVLGGLVIAAEDYGCVFPQSIVVHNRHVYFFDLYHGALIRDAPNGQQDISKLYGTANLFNSLKSYILNGKKDVSRCIGAWDDDKGSYIFSYQDTSIDFLGSGLLPATKVYGDIPPYFTLSFQEDLNQFKSLWSYLPEMMVSYGSTVICFLNGKAYLQNSNELHSNYFGQQYNQIVEVPSNVNPDEVKTFTAIEIQSNFDPEVSSMKIPAEGMETKIVKGRFVKEEGIYKASIPSDINTPGMQGAGLIQQLENGRDMRGNVAFIRILNDKTSASEISRVIVRSLKSNLNN